MSATGVARSNETLTQKPPHLNEEESIYVNAHDALEKFPNVKLR
jgi:hypothetical protein